MATRHIVCLSNAGATSLVVRRGRVIACERFDSTAAGLGAFERRLQERRTLPTRLLTDFAEEDFQPGTIPHLARRDREALLARKLAQIFPGTAFRHALAQGRQPGGSGDDRALFSAVTDAAVLRTWTDRLERWHVPVEAIHSSALVSGRLVAALQPDSARILLVTLTSAHALRQTYVSAGAIRFSRLAPVEQHPGDTFGNCIAREVTRTRHYLESQRLLQPGDRLDVCVVADAARVPEIDPALDDGTATLQRVLDIGQVAARLRIALPRDSLGIEGILAILLAREAVENHYAPPSLRRCARLRKARRAIFAVAGAALTAGIAVGGRNVDLARELHVETRATLAQVEALRRQHDHERRTAPPQEVSGEAMRQAATLHADTLRAYPTPAAFLHPVSEALGRYPGIRLTQVAWQVADDERAPLALVPTLPRDRPTLQSTATSSAAAPAAMPKAAHPGEAAFPSGRVSVALLEGTVAVSGMAFRDAIAQVDALAADIGRIPGYRAALLEGPLDTTPNANVHGRLADGSATPGRARFSLRVTRSPEPRA